MCNCDTTLRLREKIDIREDIDIHPHTDLYVRQDDMTIWIVCLSYIYKFTVSSRKYMINIFISKKVMSSFIFHTVE